MRWQPYDHTQWEAAGWVDDNVFPDNNVEIEGATGASGASKGADKAKSSWWNSDLDWGEYHGSDIHKRDELESVDEPELESDDEPERVITRTASSKAAATASSKAAPIAPKRSSRHEDGVKKARRGKTSAHKRSQTSIIMRQIRQDYVEGERRRTCDCPRWEAHVPGCNLKSLDARPLRVAPLISSHRAKSGLTPLSTETLRWLDQAREYVTQENHSSNNAASSSGSYPPHKQSRGLC